MLKTNDDVMKTLRKHTTADAYVHDWSVEEFNREPSESAEDMEWLADHLVNFEKLVNEHVSKVTAAEEEVYYEGWDAVKTKLQSLYPDMYENYPKFCNGALGYAKEWFYNNFPSERPSTRPEKKGIDIKVRS